jgi:hypothetical protein
VYWSKNNSLALAETKSSVNNEQSFILC